jgi:uncharacterized protein (DUF427 family)
LGATTHRTYCPWKGAASYYDVQVDGNLNRNAAWTYPSPSAAWTYPGPGAAARHIKGHLAFWKGVPVVE